MTVSPELLAVLACPSPDHAPLSIVETQDGQPQLRCTYCQSRFPIADGIPLLLPDEAIAGPNGLGVAAPSGDEGPAADPAGPAAHPAGPAAL